MRPTATNILGKWYRVIFTRDYPAAGEFSGEIIGDDIRISDDKAWQEHLLHEHIHGALERGGLTDALGERMEEAVVRCIENALSPLYILNPKSKHVRWDRSSRPR